MKQFHDGHTNDEIVVATRGQWEAYYSHRRCVKDGWTTVSDRWGTGGVQHSQFYPPTIGTDHNITCFFCTRKLDVRAGAPFQTEAQHFL